MSDRPRVDDPERLAEILRAGLADPDALSSTSVDLLRFVLRSDARDERRAELALAALAAVLYSRPDLVPDDLLDPVAGLLCAPSLPDGLVRHWCRLWEALAASHAAPHAWLLLRQILGDERVDKATRTQLIPVLGVFVQWREDLVGLDGVLALAGSAPLADHRAALFDHGVERFVFCAPEAFTPSRLAQLAEIFGHLPRYEYVLYALAGRPGLPAPSRSSLRPRLEGRFPFHQTATATLAQRPFRLLAVHNASMGLGDDLVRLVPLLQALLDANPALAVTLVTQRTYLYDHPRVTPVAIKDEAAVHAALHESYEGVVETFQPEWLPFNHRMELHASVDERLTARPPAFVVQGDMGRTGAGRPGKRSQFLHQRVALGGHDIAGPRGLDRLGLESTYDPGHRLLAELGLPQRAAEERPGPPSLLTGMGSADAERVWSELVPPGDGPVALVSPFGGSWATKGFLGQDRLLAAELAGLVSEDYRLVVLPQDQEWARPAAIEAALAHLGAETRARIAIAPDPADADVATRLALTERPALSSKDRVGRLFKYFAGHADLVVTVEGWLAHLAYLLARPFRLFLAASSYPPPWFPHGRGPTQRLVSALSPRALPSHSRSALLGPGDPPPLPHVPRKALLEIALAGLERSDSPETSSLIRRALASPDGTVRARAIAAMGRVDPVGSKADLIGALGDRWPAVLHESADALLRGGVDCGRELGSRYRELLQAYVDGVAGNWDAVTRVGPSVLPVLMHLTRVEVFDVHYGARQTLQRMLSRWVPDLDTLGTMPTG